MPNDRRILCFASRGFPWCSQRDSQFVEEPWRIAYVLPS